MKIPEKELRYFLGKGYIKLAIPNLIKELKKKGLKVTGKMTLSEMFVVVREAYAKSIRR